MSLRDERGEIGLMQLIIATSVFLIVMAATLSVFAASQNLNTQANVRNDMQDQARVALDTLSRQLRNLASPTPEQPQAVDKATAYDLVFQTVDANGPNAGLNAANVERERYCLGGTPGAGILYRQEQRWTTQTAPAAPSTTTCPSTDSQWVTKSQMAASITNLRDGLDRPLFTFDSSVPSDTTTVHVQLYLDSDPTHVPLETSLSTGVYLRNQNRRPVASFTADTSVPGKIVLNGSSSADPEGEPLVYVWYDGTSKIGDGVRYDYAVARGSSHTLQLRVYDPAGLEGDSATQSVTAP